MLTVAVTSGPSLTDYLQGWGTLAAVVVSLVLLGLEVQQRRRTADQELRAQARRIQVTEPKIQGGFGMSAGDRHVSVPGDPHVKVHNGSDETITRIVVELLVDGQARDSEGWDRLTGGETREWRSDFSAGEDGDAVLQVRVTFTDAADTTWMRDVDHALVLVQRASRRVQRSRRG